MKNRNIFLISLILGTFYFLFSVKQNKAESNYPFSSFQSVNLPKPYGVVNDFEDVFNDREEVDLINKVKQFEINTGAQLAIVTIENYSPSPDIASFSSELFNSWGIGHKDKMMEY